MAPDLPQADVERALETVVEHFGIEWLEKKDRYHPVCKLWSRFDFLSTRELYWLGDSIRLMAAIDDTWLRVRCRHC